MGGGFTVDANTQRTRPLFVEIPAEDLDRYKRLADSKHMTMRDLVRASLEATWAQHQASIRPSTDNNDTPTAVISELALPRLANIDGQIVQLANVPALQQRFVDMEVRIGRAEAISPLAFVRPKNAWMHTHNHSRRGVLTPLSAEKYWLPNVRDGGEREMIHLLYEKNCESASYVLRRGAGFQRIKVTADMLFGGDQDGDTPDHENHGVIVEAER